MLEIVDLSKYPMREGEKWWISHPNDSNNYFEVPDEAATLCVEDFEDFKKDVVYRISNHDKANGWIVVHFEQKELRIPEYLFRRYFDYQPFCYVSIPLSSFPPKPSFDEINRQWLGPPYSPLETLYGERPRGPVYKDQRQDTNNLFERIEEDKESGK